MTEVFAKSDDEIEVKVEEEEEHELSTLH